LFLGGLVVSLSLELLGATIATVSVPGLDKPFRNLPMPACAQTLNIRPGGSTDTQIASGGQIFPWQFFLRRTFIEMQTEPLQVLHQ
jgi:hypothetical protein